MLEIVKTTTLNFLTELEEVKVNYTVYENRHHTVTYYVITDGTYYYYRNAFETEYPYKFFTVKSNSKNELALLFKTIHGSPIKLDIKALVAKINRKYQLEKVNE